MSGAELIAQERERQITQEGWMPEHDDQHTSGEMANAARSYAKVSSLQACHITPRKISPLEWPWDEEWWKPSPDPIRNLQKAGALIAAEIDRLQRLQAKQATR
jgi:hypothetical protein